MMRAAFAGLLAGLIFAQPLSAQDNVKIGVSVGLSGYASAIDRSWRNGILLAVDAINAKGGVLGRKLEVIVEDNRSEPQEGLTGYRKMLNVDRVNVFASGCVSAATFAGLTATVRARVPVTTCAVLPTNADQLHWAFSFVAPPRFEVETRYAYLRDKTSIRAVGILHDPSPYGLLQRDVAVKSAPDFGMQVVSVESYKQDDADLSVQIGRINAKGGMAIVKLGTGGSTVTAAKNLKQLASTTLLLASIEDIAVARAAADVLGDQFAVAATPLLLGENMPEYPGRSAAIQFLGEWNNKFKESDPNYGSRAWDAVHLIAKAVETAGGVDGDKIREAFERLPEHVGAGATYKFSPESHYGILANPYLLLRIRSGRAELTQ